LPMSFCGSFAPDSPLQLLRPSQLRPSENGALFHNALTSGQNV
jgi:hypothetical protein